jgi:hypothetical protein
LPPGPLPWPLLGNMNSLWSQNRWEDKFLEWKQEYGPIYTHWYRNLMFYNLTTYVFKLRIGPMSTVTVNSYDKAIELFVKSLNLR